MIRTGMEKVLTKERVRQLKMVGGAASGFLFADGVFSWVNPGEFSGVKFVVELTAAAVLFALTTEGINEYRPEFFFGMAAGMANEFLRSNELIMWGLGLVGVGGMLVEGRQAVRKLLRK